MRIATCTLAVVITMFSFNCVLAQSPGLIVRPAGGNGVTALNPNGDAYSSGNTSGFSTDDIAQSELPFVVVPAAITEPTGDLSTGPSGGFTDIVTRVDGSGFYLYKSAANIFFRLRIGGIISGSKGYSVLVDTDAKMGASGPYADPNFVAPSGSSPGNPGFEYEVVLQTNFQVAVYSIDGTATPGAPITFPLASYAQISTALSTDGNNPDYFYDWFVPLSSIGSPSAIRTAVTTVTSPNSALQGSRSDIYGINDAAYTNTSGAWQTVVNAQPVINLTTFTSVSASCTTAPVLTSPVATGSSVAVSGTWTRLDASKPSTASITLYKNGVSAGTTTVSTGATWTITVATIANNDQFYAKALGAGESECLQSNNITASACITPPAAPVLICASLKGVSGSMPSTSAGNTVLVYLVPTTIASPSSNLVSTGVNITYPTSTSFAYYTNGCSGGTNNVATGMYMIVTQNGSCTSAPAFVCVSSGSSGTPPQLSANALTITQPLYPFSTTVSGSGSASGDILRLYVNGQYRSGISATGSAFNFAGQVLNAGDQLQVYSQTGSSCMTQSALFTVNCFTPPPALNVNATGNLLSGATAISGTSAYPGASVQLYKGIAPSGIATGSPVTVNSNGLFTVAITALVNGEVYYAVQTVNSCASAASSSATVLTPATCPSVTGSYTDASTTVSGTMPSSFTGTIRLYQDGAQIGSQVISAATAWSITLAAGTLYYNGVLSATAQAAGGAESNACTTVNVGCTPPVIPGISPASTAITVGNTVTYAISNVAAGSWYAVSDNTGSGYATSSYRTNTSGFNITSIPFTTPGTYNLKITADALTGCPASFRASVVNVSAALPLQLLRFAGQYNNNGQLLFEWATSNEINVSHFELDESTDGIHFSKLTAMALQTSEAAVHNYSITIHKELGSVAYYRLRIVDNDGKQQFSKIITLRPATATYQLLKAGPNPFTHAVIVNCLAKNTETINLTLYDVYGRTIKTYQRQVLKGENTIALGQLDDIKTGIYFLLFSNAEGSFRMTFKLEKL